MAWVNRLVNLKRWIGPRVFLGGSCNPTTWRRDFAMPVLDKVAESVAKITIATTVSVESPPHEVSDTIVLLSRSVYNTTTRR